MLIKSIRATTPENIVTQFDYNDLGELTSVTDPVGEQTTYTYDLAGRVKTENHPDRGLTTTTYDKASNVIAINTPGTQAFGGSITMVYDYNRLNKKRMPNSSGTDLYDVDYTYGSFNDGRNGAGRITVITQGGNFKSDSYRYDELGQRVEEDITVDVPMYGYRDFNTKKYFDSFGRILQAVYPDGDQVDYDYNSLGELNTIKSKVAGVTQDIVSAISYNGYSQISQLTYGNGTTTNYSYATGNTNKATTLMGSTVNAKEQGASAFTPVLSRTYTYNKQGMVAQMNRSVAGSLLSQVGNASFTDAYTYDRFGRLGAHAQSKGGTSIYSLDMQYNHAGGITFKTSNGSGFMNATALTYDLDYQYDPSKGHQLDFIWDPISATTTDFTYNTSGSITQIDDPSQAIAQNFFWNEQQQLTGVSNQQGVHHYVYDHSGERIMKSSLINSTVYLNDQVIDDVSNLEPYTVYVNPYYVVTGLMGGDRVSKHYYMNQQRVATDITINYDPNGGGGPKEQLSAKDPASAAPELSPALTNFSEVLVGLGQKPLDTASLKLPTIASYYPEASKTPATSSSAEGNPSAPRILFWYHPDYLGNVDLITERDGYTHEFFMYNPWGEEMHQWNANTYAFTSPYRFNSKELDPETGLAYYGARYYQNKIGVWLSVDPLNHLSPNQSAFHFVSNNPVIRIDPNGLTDFVNNETCETVTVNDGMNQTINVMSDQWQSAVEFSKNQDGNNPTKDYNNFITNLGGNAVPTEHEGGIINDKKLFLGFMEFKVDNEKREVSAFKLKSGEYKFKPWSSNTEERTVGTKEWMDSEQIRKYDVAEDFHTHPNAKGWPSWYDGKFSEWLGAPVYSIEPITHNIYLAIPQTSRLPVKAPQGLNWFGKIVNNY